MEAAKIIWGQISVGTKMACGARSLSFGEDVLFFNVLRGSSSKIEVKLDRGSDTYEVRMWKIRGADAKVVDERTDVYAEDLSDLIYRMCNK